MKLKATGISPLAEELLRGGGELCGVFSRALGIRCGNLAVTLQRDNIATPYGAAIPNLQTKDVEWFIGNAVTLDSELLCIGDSVQIEMRGTEQWDSMEIQSIIPLTDSACRSARKAIQRQMIQHRREGGFSLLLERLHWETGDAAKCPRHYLRALEAIQLLRQGALFGNRSQIIEAQKNLVGLGEGLTPSGDDFLTGFWTTLFMLSHPSLIKPISGAVGMLSHLASRTTIYGWSELRALQQGFCSEPLCTAVKVLGDSERQIQALDRLASFGGTTGLDTMLGIGEALRLLAEFNFIHGIRSWKERTLSHEMQSGGQ